MSPEEQHRMLVTGLADQHLDLYRTNAWFRASVDQFALMLPLLVDGLASHANDRQEEQDKAYRALLAAGSISQPHD